MRAAIYPRVSTADTNSEMQVRDLREYAARQGWNITEVYQDVISGAKASRPGLNRLIDDARQRGLIAFWSGSWTDSTDPWWTA
jgi:DNA invertase Pin-like site-specific DNA recombinase